MGTSHIDIILSAEALSLGETARIQCPSCLHGRPTLSLTRQEDGSIVWNCYRASCSERGAKGGHRMHGTTERTKVAVPDFTPFTGELRNLTDDESAYLEETIGWTKEHQTMARVKYAPVESRYAMPIFDPMGIRRGYVLRAYQDGVYNKALTRMDNGEPHLSWYGAHHEGTTTIIVEDIPSAVRAGLYVQSVALCGTGCGPDYALEIARHTRGVMWCLDADATVLALRLHNKYRGLFHESKVRPIPCDLKDMDEEQLKEILI